MAEVQLPSGRSVEADVADNTLSRAKGMSFRSKGKVLFVFPRAGKPAIDMMFLSVPLQLIFLDREKKVVDVQRAEPWKLDPRTWRLYTPRQESNYLLESAEFLEVEEGDRLEFEI